MPLIRDGLVFDVRAEIPIVAGLPSPSEPWVPGRVTTEASDHGRRLVVAMEARNGPTVRRRNAVAFVFDLDVDDPAVGHAAAALIGEMLLKGWVQQLNGGPASWLGDGWVTHDPATSRATTFLVRKAE